MENEIIRSIENGMAYVNKNIAEFLSDSGNAVFFFPDDEFDCLNFVEKHLDYIKQEKKIKTVLYLLPKKLSRHLLENERRFYLSAQEINDLYCLSLQSRISDNFYLLSFKDVPGREVPPSVTNGTVILNGVLGIPVQKMG